MSRIALDRLRTCHEGLIRALDAHDAAAVEAATAELRGAVDEVRTIIDWRAEPGLRTDLSEIVALVHATQARVNFLTDHVRGRIDRLAAARGELPAATYTAAGR